MNDEPRVDLAARDGERAAVAEAASLLLAHVSEPIIVDGRPIYPEASIGVVAIDASYATPEELLRDADIAMYEAKHRGRAQFAIFDAPMRQRVADDSQLEDDLRRAIERGELVPHYQPIVNMAMAASIPPEPDAEIGNVMRFSV